jgi:hypothetical protein
MSISSRAVCAVVAVLTVSATLPAQADLSIAKRATKNVSCTAGSCVATARKAVMNVADLQNLLASQPAVSLDAGAAKNIAVDAALTWASSATLSLTAQSSLTVNRPVTVAGSGSVTIHTADGGLSFAPKASLTFWDLGSALTVNGAAYTLVGDIKSIGSDVQSGVALARDYDASSDGTYMYCPMFIYAPSGHLEGLGHTITHFSANNGCLVYELDGALTNLRLSDAIISDPRDTTAIAVRSNSGLIDHVSVSGRIVDGGFVAPMGGLAGENLGTIRNSSAHVSIPIGGAWNGALVGVNQGMISNSWAEGEVRGMGDQLDLTGGLVGDNAGMIKNSYSLANIHFRKNFGKFDSAHGGLVGQTSSSPHIPSIVLSSYSAGAIAPHSESGLAGGTVGSDGSSSTFGSTYWVTDSSPHNPKQGAGNIPNDPGITGLTGAQMKSALPAGFDPRIWGQSPSINNGYPYLLANPPQ